MSNTYNTYPIFEGDQVLTANHLNGLRTFLEARNLSTRNRLIGSGIVCGLNIVEKREESILISAGLGITSKGYLLELKESDCRFITEYIDKPVSDTGEKPPLEKPGLYKLFRGDGDGDGDGDQVPVWELLTAEEEVQRNDPEIRPLKIDSSDEISITTKESDATVKLSEHVLVLYLELDDEDLESCFGDNCDDKGIRRTFNVRKLLVPESVIAGSSTENPESKKFLCLKRPAFGGNENNYSLTQTSSYFQFRRKYEEVIEKNAGELDLVLRSSWSTWPSLLKESFRTNPFEAILKGTSLSGKIDSSFGGTVYNVQQKFDCLKFLIQAWNEFQDVAEQATAYCLSEPDDYPRHLVLGPVESGMEQLGKVRHRHYFRPADTQYFSKKLSQEAILKYRRLVEMTKHIRVVTPSLSAVRITPGSYAPEKLSDQPIPFYFRLDGGSKLDHVWNPEHALRYRFGDNVSWHKRSDGENPCIRQPLDHNPDRHSFYRIEGHIGKPFVDVLQNLEGERQRKNLPVKIIGLKLSSNPANISFDTECKFDDLEQQYELLTTELSCLFEEEITFFTNLRINRESILKEKESIPVEEKLTDEKRIAEEKAIDKNIGQEIDFEKKIDPELEKKIEPEFDIRKKTEADILSGATSKYGMTDIGMTSETRTSEAISFNIFQESKLKAEQTNSGAQYMSMSYTQPAELKITPQTRTFTTGDLLNDQLRKYQTIDYYRIHHDFPELFKDIRLPGLIIMKPVELANQIRAILELLPDELGELDIVRLSAAFDTLIKIASDYRDELHARNDDLDGQKAMILFRLDKLIYSCSRQKLLALQERYRDRVKKYSDLRLLKNFAETHSGLEHQSGVPKGGTFVLIYVDENESQEPPKIPPFPGPIPFPPFPGPTPPFPGPVPSPPLPGPTPPFPGPVSPAPEPPTIQPFPMPVKLSISDVLKSKPEELTRSMSEPMTSSDVRVLTKDLQAITNTLKLESGLSAQLKDQITKLEVDFNHKIGELIRLPRPAPTVTRNVVVADFALPYLYKCECPEVSMIVISQITFSLSKTEFCKKDSSRYEFITDPAGGIVESDAGGIVSEGNRYFFVPEKAEPEGEKIRFTYQMNNQTVVFNIRLFNPVADFTFKTDRDEEGTVTVHFINRSSGADRYEWDFGDGNTSSETSPVHRYRDFEGDRVAVTLKAGKSGCSDRISKPVEIPKEIPVEFGIEDKVDFPEKTYCTTDDQLFRFHIRPDDKLIEGKHLDGVRKTHDGYVLDPSAYSPGTYTFKYLEKSLKVKILEGPTRDFTHEVLRESDQIYSIRFNYKGKEGDTITWQIGDKDPQEGAPIDVVFDRKEGYTHDVQLKVVTENGCSVFVERTLTFDVNPPADAEEGDIRPPVEEEDTRPPMEEEADIRPPVEEEADIRPPVDEEADIRPPVEEEADIRPPVDEDVDIRPPVEEEDRFILDIRTDLDKTRDAELDIRFFEGKNLVIEDTERVIDEVIKETDTAEGMERFKTGELNDKIASEYKILLDNTTKLVTDTSRTGTKEEIKYTTNLLDSQASSLIRLVSEEEKDVNKTSEMGKLLVNLDSTLKTMKEEGIDVDPDKQLEKTVTEAKLAVSDQPKLFEAFTSIEKTLRM